MSRLRRKLSTQTKFRMSLAKQGAKNPMHNKHHSENTKRKISKAMRDYWRSIPKE